MPTWTLSVEFFFYLCFPLLSRLAEKLGSGSLLGLIAALLAFAAITGSSALIDNQFALFAWMKWTPVPLLRLPEFLIGIFVAELHLRGHRMRIPAWPIALLLVVGLALATSPRIAAFATAMSALLIMPVPATLCKKGTAAGGVSQLRRSPRRSGRFPVMKGHEDGGNVLWIGGSSSGPKTSAFRRDP